MYAKNLLKVENVIIIQIYVCQENDKCNANPDYQKRLEGYDKLLLEGQRVKTIKDNINEIDEIVDKIKNDDQMYKKKDIEKISDVYPYSSINTSCLARI